MKTIYFFLMGLLFLLPGCAKEVGKAFLEGCAEGLDDYNRRQQRRIIKVVEYEVPRYPYITKTSIGDLDFVYGSNGYSGTGYYIGNCYFYNDNQGNHYTHYSI